MTFPLKMVISCSLRSLGNMHFLCDLFANQTTLHLSNLYSEPGRRPRGNDTPQLQDATKPQSKTKTITDDKTIQMAEKNSHTVGVKKPGTTASFLCREKSPTNYTANGHKIAHRKKGAKCKQLTIKLASPLTFSSSNLPKASSQSWKPLDDDLAQPLASWIQLCPRLGTFNSIMTKLLKLLQNTSKRAPKRNELNLLFCALQHQRQY